VYGIDATHCGEVAKDDLVWTYSDHGTIGVEELLYDLALSEAENVCCHPGVRDGRIPGARDCAERRQEEVVDGAEEDVHEGESD
jgi:hypothetical protein